MSDFQYGPNELKQVIELLPKKDQKFASDLVEKAGKYTLSDRQLYWVDLLTKQAKNEVPVKPAGGNVGSFKGVYALFQIASKHLKFPKIRLQTETGQPVTLYVAGEHSKNPGVVNVTDGRPYGENKWYGRVQIDGEWEAGRQYAETSAVRGLLTQLAEKPAETAAAYGRLTGRCCFCNSVLTDENSTAVGYGPTCAKNFGLPYGVKPAVLDQQAELELHA